MKNRFAYAVAALVWGVTLTANAQVYRCKTATGGTEYSQVPCGKDAQLMQSQRESIDTTSPPSDPFGVQRARVQAEADDGRGGRPVNGTPSTSSPSSRRQIDRAACESADRDVQIQYRHARRDPAEIRRKEKVADWECGRELNDDAQAASGLKVPMKASPPPPIITSCDPSGCWDSNGGRYNRAGNSNTYFSSSGACTRSGMTMVCP